MFLQIQLSCFLPFNDDLIFSPFEGLTIWFWIFVFQDILRDVNSKVAEKERKQRLLEIYHRVDPKSTIMYNGRKFKKSDILSASRRLMFEGVGTLQQSRGRTIQVIMVVLSDIVIFLQENNQKYYFITPENKVIHSLGSFLLTSCHI